MASTVERQSPASRNPVTVLRPSASDANMAERWDMLLSPGMTRVAWIGPQARTVKLFMIAKRDG